MSRLLNAGLLLGAAMTLAAQPTLTVGPGAGAPGHTGVANVTLTSGGTSVAGLNFDVGYDGTIVTGVTVAIAGTASTAQKGFNFNNGPVPTCAANPTSPCGLPGIAAKSQRAIIAGDFTTQQTLTNSGQGVIADGVVATITFTIAPGAALGSTAPLTLTNAAGTTPAAGAVTFTTTNGTVTVSNSYLVGDVAPSTADTVGNFGNGTLDIQDLIQEFFAVNKVPGFVPAACSDRFDAMDVAPADTVSTRGGNGSLDIQDLILEFFRVNKVDQAKPTRASLGGVCPPHSGPQSLVRTARTTERPPAVGGTLEVGSPESVGTGQERVPVYMLARQEITRVAVTFGIGDQKSQLHFVAASIAPTLSHDSQPGAVVAAWLDGVSIQAGGRLLLGYITGPAGFSKQLTMFGSSAFGLNENREVGLDASGVLIARQ